MGLSFYPGSEDKVPGLTPGPGLPSVRLTADSVEKVVSYYRQRLADATRETKVAGAIIIEGRTPAGDVRVTVEPFEGRTQVMISGK